MSPRRPGRIPRVWTVVAGLVILAVAVAARQTSAPTPGQASDVPGFKEFSAHVQAYGKIRQAAASEVPALKTTDLPEMIAAHQAALARKIQEARPGAKAGDIFTPAACEAFRRASLTAIGGPNAAGSRAYMQSDGPDPAMPLPVNGIYPATAPITTVSPDLLAVFPPLPAELAYRVVGRSLVLIDVQSNVIIDVARLILPPA